MRMSSSSSRSPSCAPRGRFSLLKERGSGGGGLGAPSLSRVPLLAGAAAPGADVTRRDSQRPARKTGECQIADGKGSGGGVQGCSNSVCALTALGEVQDRKSPLVAAPRLRDPLSRTRRRSARAQFLNGTRSQLGARSPMSRERVAPWSRHQLQCHGFLHESWLGPRIRNAAQIAGRFPPWPRG
ncbi:unnamed protein product [Lampetra planeri]